jgi:hypothetical protein
MRVQVLHVADCPGTVTLLERLSTLEIKPETVLVRDESEARAVGMAGSPTLLVDGVDPFADGAAPTLACRLYRDGFGVVSGAPSVGQLLAVLREDWSFAGTTARSHRLPEELRARHRLILRAFLDTGRAPDLEWLWQNGITDDDLRRLSTADLVHRDGAGAITVAYPFSGTPTAHRVRLAGGPQVFAMCAIDALGIPRMAGRDGVIESADPVTGEPVRVDVVLGTWRWEPAGTVVTVARSDEGGPVYCCSCPNINFHTVSDGLVGDVLDQRAAVELADRCFGGLLA